MNVAVSFITVILGSVISALLSGVNKKTLLKILNTAISAVINTTAFICGLYIYARISHIPFDFSSLFPEKASVIVGIYLYLLISVVSGIVLGSIESGGIENYMKKLFHLHFFKISVAIFMIFNIVFASAGVFLTYTEDHKTLIISEICPHNFNLISDSSDNFSDYIELYNNSSYDIKLSDFYLSENFNEPDKFQLPDIDLPAGDYIIIWADGSEVSVDSSGDIHANFRLSDDETVILSKAGKVISAVKYGNLPDNVSMTLYNGKYIRAFGTPLESNDTCIEYKAATLEAPQFNIQSGIYTEDHVSLEISSLNNANIYYTTDGSEPDINAEKYTEPLILTDVSNEPNKYVSIKNTVTDYENREIDYTPVDKANIIRAIVIDDDGNFSEITTGTYIVGETAEKYQGYSVLSVVSDPENLFGDNGICVTGREYDEWYNNTDRSTEAPATNFYQHGKLWEREAVIQLWDEHGEITINQNCGIRVQGNASRGYSIKRLSLYAREFYSGSNYFSSSLFGDIKTHSIYLRNDNYDIVVHRLLENRNSISVQRSIPVVMFIDGEFYCQTYIREKYDEKYLAEYYNVDQNDIVIISDRKADSGKEADIKLFEDFVSYVSNNDASDPEIYEQICQQMDIQSFIDFICINLYMNNIDWSLYKNFKAWRTVTTDGGGYNDGKWRWCIYDTDAVGWSGDSLGIRREEINPFSVKLPYTHHGDHKLTYSEAPIYSSLIKNPDFKRRFVLTYFDLMNTCFSEEYSQPIIDELGLTDNPIWKTFLTERSEYAINNIVNELELCGKTGELTVSTNNTSGGTVKVNTVTVNFSENSWHGIYATDYPLIITAEPADGWEFAGWEGSLESNSFSLTVDLTEAGIDLKAIFVKTGGEN